jgi:hypothetical protein
MTMTDDLLFETLDGVTTATLTTILLKKGLRNVWIRGAKPIAAPPEGAEPATRRTTPPTSNT